MGNWGALKELFTYNIVVKVYNVTFHGTCKEYLYLWYFKLLVHLARQFTWLIKGVLSKVFAQFVVALGMHMHMHMPGIT